MTQLPLGERIILTYALCIYLDWHQELKASWGYDISVINQHLLHAIADEVWALNDKLVKVKVSLSHPINKHLPHSFPLALWPVLLISILHLCSTFVQPSNIPLLIVVPWTMSCH
ncbi:hypothetical protein JVT61DRAFT_7204 [Boletus reticuloceps]|uniref:Uncharacterized protein n=1 Tax=Boletus reticuloceps TaxID=495285 RepID=A0A8I3A796_9AGAM|nr:hypothetical protein JVT61DRAFT_7204 [Boletus reticuloceps]